MLKPQYYFYKSSTGGRNIHKSTFIQHAVFVQNYRIVGFGSGELVGGLVHTIGSFEGRRTFFCPSPVLHPTVRHYS